MDRMDRIIYGIFGFGICVFIFFQLVDLRNPKKPSDMVANPKSKDANYGPAVRMKGADSINKSLIYSALN